jgi:transcriptional regulator with XRE-family HTH domain
MVRVKLREHELKKLSGFRTDAWLTQERVAGSLNIKVNTFADYERGKSNIPLEFLQKLAEMYGKEEIKKFGVKAEGKKFVTKEKQSYKNSHESDLIAPVLDVVNTFRKTRTVQTDELNFYVPEKWKR